MRKIFISGINILLVYFLIACTFSDNKHLEQALQFAGDNQGELEKVLAHYIYIPNNQVATRFLIMNMRRHTGIDSSNIGILQSVYDKYVRIFEKHYWKRTQQWYKDINTLWIKGKIKIIPMLVSPRQKQKDIKADWLINEIDSSFKAWKENAYTQNYSFEDFCQFILSYRFAERIYSDNARDIFYQRHAHIFNNSIKDFRKMTDSLHQINSYLMHNDWAAVYMPIYNASTFIQMKRGTCDDKVWYNSPMISALSMSVAIDFVPEWGNRSSSNSWNSLIVGGETYSFEPFEDNNWWKYKRIYKNEGFDMFLGELRLLKVYRRTFKHYFSGPLRDKSVAREDIPSLFKNPFMKDVSSQYFDATDIKSTITEPISENVRYCYFCVFGAKGWQPVQWVKIGWSKKVTFKEMGKDIVYLPMFYQNGALTPAASAFVLTKDSKREELKCINEKMPVTVRNDTAYLYPYQSTEVKTTLNGAKLTGCNKLNVELWYWDNQWIKGGNLKGNSNFITFENIPQKTIYRVKVRGTNDRIFTHKNGIIHWC